MKNMKLKCSIFFLLLSLAVAAMFVSGCNGLNPEVILLEPANDSNIDLTVTFRWTMKDVHPTEIFSAMIYTDKGADPLDGSFEDAFFSLNKDLLNLGHDRFPSLTKKWYD